MKFAYLYALPGYAQQPVQQVTTDLATFYAVAVDFNNREQAAEIAKQLFKDKGISMIELCGGLASAEIIAAVKQAVNHQIPVGGVYYGPEFREMLVKSVSTLA